MKDSRLKGIIALAVVTILAFGVIYGSKILVKDEGDKKPGGDQVQEDLPGAIDVEGADGIVSAREITDDSDTVTSYSVVAKARGFAPNLTLEVIFESDAKTIQEVKVVSHGETPGYGAKMEEDNYMDQFKGISAPIYLKGNAPSADNGEIDAISGATVTTEGLLKIVNNAYEFISAHAGK